jgi:hypothetical protein
MEGIIYDPGRERWILSEDENVPGIPGPGRELQRPACQENTLFELGCFCVQEQ